MNVLSVIGRAIVAFAATNIDDIFVLTLFFAQKHLKRWHIVAGQYLGLTGLISISLIGYVVGLFISRKWIGLLGFAPIVIGIKHFINWKQGGEDDSSKPANVSSMFAVAAVTFANGGDNVGVYVPLFASSDLQAVCLTLLTFAGLIAIWCILGFYMGNHPVVRRIVDRYGHILVPCVLIGLGIYILLSTR
jgi:cadmium resistance protein CadD (predicted permease)